MKKTWFFLVSLYVFVIQFGIIGVLWKESNFFWLALINLVMVFGFLGIYNLLKDYIKFKLKVISIAKKVGDSIKKMLRKYLFVIIVLLLFVSLLERIFLNISPVSVWYFFGLFVLGLIIVYKDIKAKRVYFFRKLFLAKDIIGWFSLFTVLGFYIILPVAVYAKILLSLIIGFILFFILIKSFRAIGVYSIWKLKTTKIYIILTLLSFIWTIYSLIIIIPKGAVVDTTNNVYSGVTNFVSHTWDVVSEETQKVSTQVKDWTVDATSNIKEGVVNTVDNVKEKFEKDPEPVVKVKEEPKEYESNGELLSTGTSHDIEKEKPSGDLIGADETKSTDPLNYGAVLRYLLNENDIELSQAKGINFRYVSTANSLYPYYRTAYDMKLIGTTINPLANVRCDTYIVIKGLVEGWNVKDYTDIKAGYWTYAEEEELLNGCKIDEFVSEATL